MWYLMKTLERAFQRKSARVTILFLLYFSQGLPFGFQATALPVYLRSQGISLAAIGFVSALAAPWLFKPLWAPLVDRYYSKRFGRRKQWIIPLQLSLFLTILLASGISPEKNLVLLLTAVFLMNLFAATQDIAVDGLAVDILELRDLGPGNAAQVVGYKAGMIISGGLLVWLSDFIGWDGLFIVMALLTLIPLCAIIFYGEGSARYTPDAGDPSIAWIIRRAIMAFRLPGAGWVIVFIAGYKLGESMIDIMFKPFLIDNGFSPSQIGLWIGTYGMAASLAGSFLGGVLSARLSIFRALSLAALVRVVPLALEWLLTLVQPTGIMVIGITIAEHFFGGMLTTAMFAFMMSQVDKSIGATHYTILAAVEVVGKSPGGFASGMLAESLGYSGLFLLGVALSLLLLALLPKLGHVQKR